MILSSADRAVVEILDGNTSLGTGFLVAPGHVLTARHVVGARPKVDVRFVENTTVKADVVELAPGGKDWAVLAIGSVPAGIVPVPLDKIGNVTKDARWYSVGFAKLRNQTRGNFTGIVRGVTQVPTLDLRCDDLVNMKYDDAKGLSGAPCMVDGAVVGLIVDVLHKDGNVVAGEVAAVPIEMIAATKVVLPIAGGPRLPWQEVYAGALRGLEQEYLEIAAAQASLKDPDFGPQLPVQIARRMINQGVVGTARVLRQLGSVLDPELIDLVMDAAVTLWVSSLAAESLARTAVTGRTGVIATETEWSAKHHSARAFDHCGKGTSPWPSLVIEAPAEEPFPDSVLDKTYDALAIEMKIKTRGVELTAQHRKRVRERFETWSGAGVLVTAFVLSQPRQDVVTKLRADFSSLLIIFMSKAAPSVAAGVAPPQLDLIQPSPTSEDEANARDRNEDARALL